MTSVATVGVDVGGSYVKGVLRRPDGSIAARDRLGTPRRPGGLVDAVAGLAESLGSGLPLGVGVAGLVDQGSGRLVWAPHLPDEDLDVAGELVVRLGVPVMVDNDANLAALAEHRQGAGVGTETMVLLTLGTGIGMGLVVDGEVVRGRAHAGEVGHITVDPEGAPCPCGRIGCWETKVSGRRLDADARRLLGEGAVGADLTPAAHAGDAGALGALTEAARWLAGGVETIVLTLDPEMVVVGGAVVADDLLLDPVREALAVTEGAGHRQPCLVTPGILGGDAGAVGAAIGIAEEVARK